MINESDYPTLRFQVSMESIGTLLEKCNVAYSSGMSSSAVDAFCAGVPVISILDQNKLNLSPLRGFAGVLFASDPEELASALISMATNRQDSATGQEYFTVNPLLPRWQRLLLA